MALRKPPMHRVSCFAGRAAACLLALGTFVHAASAQGGSTSVIMSPEPLALEPVGLELEIPADASGFRADRGEVPTLEISPSLGHWYLVIQAPQRRVAAQGRAGAHLPVDDLTDQILENLRASYRVDQSDGTTMESRASVLAREKGLVVAGRPASRFYVTFPESDRERVRMYTLVDAGAGQMVSFDLLCEFGDRAEARTAYLAVLASAQFSGNTEVAASRAIAIETTEALLGMLTSADYDRALALADGRWDRLSQPAETGLAMDDTERGYRWIRAWKGRKGEINPERSEESWTEDDRREGYLVRMDGRMAQRSATGQWTLIDTRVVCFMTFDRQHEAWTASTTFRQGDQRPVTNTEFGVRDGQEMKIARRGSMSNTLQPAVPPRGYVNQVEFYLLPQLLVGHAAEATYGVYAYAGGDTSVRYRQFELEPGSGGAIAWQLTTQLGEESRSISVYDGAGGFRGSDRGDGTRWTPSNREELLDLWRRKGLPTSTR
ncbi:MAG: hypothetical protein HRU13_08610 [Phycisphaerales bacterium]|nr:hypothetical protein [Phycisphaerales bacterium]